MASHFFVMAPKGSPAILGSFGQLSYAVVPGARSDVFFTVPERIQSNRVAPVAGIGKTCDAEAVCRFWRKLSVHVRFQREACFCGSETTGALIDFGCATATAGMKMAGCSLVTCHGIPIACSSKDTKLRLIRLARMKEHTAGMR